MKCSEALLVRAMHEYERCTDKLLKKTKFLAVQILLVYGWTDVFKESLKTVKGKLEFKSHEEHGRFGFCTI